MSANIKAFDELLERTVRAPRLSGSKVKELSAAAMKSVAEDQELVTSLLRLNASLPAASTSRVSALYVFDAIAREAKRLVDKGAKGGKGTPAGLLAKMEAVVDAWVGGMVDDGRGGVWAEGRDKTRKIIDIWRKSSTFPESCITQLQARISESGGGDAGPSSKARSTTPTYPPPPHILEKYAAASGGSSAGGSGRASRDRSAASPVRTPPPPGQLPPEIMALLGVKSPTETAAVSKAETSSAIDAVLANVRSGPAPSASAPALDPAQLAALANLSSLGSLIPGASAQGGTTAAPLAAPAPALAPAPAPTGAHLPPRPANGHGENGYERRRSRSPERRWDGRNGREARDAHGRDGRDVRDARDRRDSREWGGERRDMRDVRDVRDRDREMRDRDRDARDEMHRRDSRDSRDDMHRRDSRDRDFHRRDDFRDRGRDERDLRERDRGEWDHGRDRRGSHSREDRYRDHPRAGGPGDHGREREPHSRLPPKPSDLPARPAGLPSRPAGAPMGRGGSGGGGGTTPQAAPGSGLAAFDLSTFNPTQPESWSALAAAWKASTGREPNQLELMGFLATGQVPDGGQPGMGAGMPGMQGMQQMGGMGMGMMPGMGMMMPGMMMMPGAGMGGGEEDAAQGGHGGHGGHGAHGGQGAQGGQNGF